MQGVLSCLRLLTTSNLLLLSFVFLYSGLETSFWAGAFPSSVSFTLQLASRKMVRQDGLLSVCQNQVMGLCSVMVPIGSIFGGGALILFKSFVNRVGRGPVVCIGQICTSSPPSTLLVAPSRALSITAHHCCSLTSLSPTPQRHNSRSEYLHHHQCSSRNNYQMSEHLPHQTSLFDQSQDCCFTLLPSSAVFSSSPIHLHLEIQRKKL